MCLEIIVLVIFQCCIMNYGKVAAADVTIICPKSFESNQTNTITCIINSTALTICAIPPSQVTFNLRKQGELSSRTECFTSYGCASTSNPSSTDPCTCTEKTAGIFTYQYLFPANKATHEGAELTCTVCPGTLNSQENCDSLKFGEDSTCEKEEGAIACIVLAQIVIVIIITISILYFVRSYFTWSFKWMLCILVASAVVVVILLSLSLGFACEDFKDDSPCYTHCVVVIVFVVIDVVVGVITVVVVVTQNERDSEIDTSDGGAAASQKNPNDSNGTSLPTGSNRDK